MAMIAWLHSMLPTTGGHTGRAACRRDREDRDREQHEAAEREALKNMTEAERRAWEAAHPKARSLQTAALPCHLALTFLGAYATHSCHGNQPTLLHVRAYLQCLRRTAVTP